MLTKNKNTQKPFRFSKLFAALLLLSLVSPGFDTTQAATAEVVIPVGSLRKDVRSELLPKVRIFENGNTFVQFPEASRLVGASVVVQLDDILTADDLMEALIITRTASKGFAKEVRVTSKSGGTPVVIRGTNDRIGLDLARLFAVAGASQVFSADARFFAGRPLNFTANEPKFAVNDQNSNFKYFFSSQFYPELGQKIREHFPVQELPKNIEESQIQGSTIFFLLPSVAPVNEMFFRGMAQIRAWRKRGAKVVLITPYQFYARSDKVDQLGVTETASLVADIIEDSGVESTVMVRPHALQTAGFYRKPTMVVSGRTTLTNYLRREYGIKPLAEDPKSRFRVVAPDAGAQKDDNLYAGDLGLAVSVINKERDPITGIAVIRGISGGSFPENSLALVIDDETSSGSTGDLAGKLLHEEGVQEVVFVVSHLAGEARKALESPYVNRVIALDTVPVPDHVRNHPKVSVVSIGPEIAKHLNTIAFPTGENGNGSCEAGFR